MRTDMSRQAKFEALDSGRDLYTALVEQGAGDPSDWHVFACAIVIGLRETDRPLAEALGLTSEVPAGAREKAISPRA